MKISVGILICALFCQFSATTSLAQTQSGKTKEDKPVRSLVGRWKSSTELTLQSLNQIEGISEESLQYLKKNVFGRLTVEFTDTETRSFFGKADSSDQFSPYKILKQSADSITIEHKDPLSEKIIVSNLFWELDCYYELVSKWQYKEYFCPAVEKKRFIAIPKANMN